MSGRDETELREPRPESAWPADAEDAVRACLAPGESVVFRVVARPARTPLQSLTHLFTGTGDVNSWLDAALLALDIGSETLADGLLGGLDKLMLRLQDGVAPWFLALTPNHLALARRFFGAQGRGTTLVLALAPRQQVRTLALRRARTPLSPVAFQAASSCR